VALRAIRRRAECSWHLSRRTGVVRAEKIGQHCCHDKGLRKVIFPRVTDVIAHRGASKLAKENTIEAFLAAVACGANGIELDARRRSDGALVVHHDATLGGRPIIATAGAELPEWVPTLSDALDACAGAFVNIEIKNSPGEPDFDPDDSVAERLMADLAQRSEPSTAWLISSFRIESVDRCRAINPEVPTAWLTANPVSPADIAVVVAAGHTAIHPWVPTIDEALVESCHESGLRVNTWTCNDPERAVEMASWGIDGICTDVPDVILAALTTA